MKLEVKKKAGEASQTEKEPEKAPHARKRPSVSAALTKIVKKAAQIADLMDGADVAADLKVLRQAKRATHQIYDTKKKKLVKVPDHKTRLAATTLSRAYHEGKPIERSVNLSGSFEDYDSMRDRIGNSPLAAKLLGLGGVQETGPEKRAEVTREE